MSSLQSLGANIQKSFYGWKFCYYFRDLKGGRSINMVFAAQLSRCNSIKFAEHRNITKKMHTKNLSQVRNLPTVYAAKHTEIAANHFAPYAHTHTKTRPNIHRNNLSAIPAVRMLSTHEYNWNIFLMFTSFCGSPCKPYALTKAIHTHIHAHTFSQLSSLSSRFGEFFGSILVVTVKTTLFHLNIV